MSKITFVVLFINMLPIVRPKLKFPMSPFLKVSNLFIPLILQLMATIETCDCYQTSKTLCSICFRNNMEV